MGLRVQSPSRLVQVDLVRVIAMALMVQGHTLDVLLKPAYQSAWWYNLWQFCRGFTAPTFLLLSGFSFALATIRKFDDHIVVGSKLFARLRKFAFFVLLGYSMHFPVHSIRDLSYAGSDAWLSFSQVDVLQTIGLSLIFLQLLVLAVRRKWLFAAITLVGSLAIAFTAPLLWNSAAVNALPLAFRSALIGTTGSLFPLLPWSAYVLLGAGLGTVYLTAAKSSVTMLRAFVPAGLLLMCAGVASEGLSLSIYGETNYWPTTPHLFLTRIGFVLAILGIATIAVPKLQSSAGTLRSFAEESLLVYFVHVDLLYGSVWNPGLRNYLGSSLSFANAYCFVIGMIASMALLAFYWNRSKKTYPTHSFAVRTAVIALAAFAVS
ncbi:MAG TPA: heparan-alpha-glucosaminide N-acetyltransferase domain-containing protein [Terriglobales bacterium]|nr:heparan-alpha-glucosaminide N-acetyltransferase domain-containing protein [Terriglobales bacterium]